MTHIGALEERYQAAVNALRDIGEGGWAVDIAAEAYARIILAELGEIKQPSASGKRSDEHGW